MYISWRQGVSGDFATAANWSPAAVPGPADDSIIGTRGTYTVTSSIAETVDSLIIGKPHATLFITGASSFITTNGGINDGTIFIDNDSVLNLGTTGESTTLTNLGAIELGSAANGQFVVAGNVSLQGDGKITLSDNSDNVIAGVGSPATLSTNNVISGAGTIGGAFPLTLVNEVGGVIDATGVNALKIDSSTAVENSGTLESTNPEKLSTTGGLILAPFSMINNTPLGVIGANGENTNVLMEGFVTIAGGTLETRGADASIEIHGDGNLLDGAQSDNPINIEGNVLITSFSTVELMGTVNNNGVITAASEDALSALIAIEGNVTLLGGGEITLTNSGPAPPVSSIFGGELTNVDNVISGTGTIQLTTLTNEADGTINANATTPLTLVGAGSYSNAGLMEATHGGTLLFENVIIANDLCTTNGTIEAGKESTIGLEGATILDGFVTTKHGALIEAEQGLNTIAGALVTNAGTISAEGANLTIIGNVINKGALDANNATLAVDGAVSCGKATIEGAGQIEFGASSSAEVTFAPQSDGGILKLDDPSAFTGTVSGLTTGDFIDLTNINFADNPTMSYSSKTHVLTVTDSVSQVTDTVKLKGVPGSFSAQNDGNGGTLITDSPPPANVVTVSHDHDNFVFAPNLGEGSFDHFDAHSGALDATPSESADFAALLAQTHQDVLHPTAHDLSHNVHHAETLSTEHAHSFLV